MIIDSSSLIIFAKLGMLDLLERLYGIYNISEGIYKETVKDGLEIGAPDANLIKKTIEEGKIKVISLKDKYKNLSNELRRIYLQLGIGESEAIALALQEKKKKVIMDEKLGRQVCTLHEIKPIGSLRVLLDSFLKSLLSEKEVRKLVKDITKYKFRIGADVMNEFWDVFDKIKKR